MTETQAMSDAAGAPATQAEQSGGESAKETAGRAAVGRAAVPAEKTESGTDQGATSSRTPQDDGGLTSTGSFARAAGMPKPPESADLASDSAERKGFAGRTVAGMASVRGAASTFASSAVRVTEAMRSSRGTATAAASRGPRRARLGIKRVDPWSVLKFSFAVSFVLLVVIVVASAVLYLALDQMGVFESVNTTLADLFTQNGGEGGFKITAGSVIGTSAIIGAINILLFTSLSTLGAFIYNVCADLVGGIEITLAERD